MGLFAGKHLYEYSGRFLKGFLEDLQSGWRPPSIGTNTSTNTYLSYDVLAGIAGNLELGLDTYSQYEVLLGGEKIPGPVGLGLILIKTGIENRDQSLTRIGYEMLASVIIDLGVDAGAGYAAIQTGGAATAASGPVGGAIVGGGTFLLVQLGYDRYISPYVDNAVDNFFGFGQNALQVSPPNATPHPYGSVPLPAAVPTPSSPSPVGTPVP